jgi:hypothetical protein
MADLKEVGFGLGKPCQKHEMKHHNEIIAVWASFPGCPKYF